MASMMALLKENKGDAYVSKCWGIFLMSVSRPTQRNVRLLTICCTSSFLVMFVGGCRFFTSTNMAKDKVENEN